MKPDGWFVGTPVYIERRGWEQYTFDTRERAKAGRRSREWTVLIPSSRSCARWHAACGRSVRAGSRSSGRRLAATPLSRAPGREVRTLRHVRCSHCPRSEAGANRTAADGARVSRLIGAANTRAPRCIDWSAPGAFSQLPLLCPCDGLRRCWCRGRCSRSLRMRLGRIFISISACGQARARMRAPYSRGATTRVLACKAPVTSGPQRVRGIGTSWCQRAPTLGRSYIRDPRSLSIVRDECGRGSRSQSRPA